MKIAEQIKRVFKYIEEGGLLTDEIISNLCNVNYCKENLKGRMNSYPQLIELDPNLDEAEVRKYNSAQSRYYVSSTFSVNYKGDTYLFCSQLHIEDKEKWVNWVRRTFDLDFDAIAGKDSKILNFPGEAFFTEKEMESLKRWAGKDYDQNNEEHLEVYRVLKEMYGKVKVWGEILAEYFNLQSSEWEVRQSPIDQQQRFTPYQWCKFFPNLNKKSTFVAMVSSIKDNKFILKIDKLNTITQKRTEHFEKICEILGPEKIYFELDFKEVSSWEELFKKTEFFLEEMDENFKKVATWTNRLAVAAKVTWNSNKWMDHPTEKDLLHSSGYANIDVSSTAMESINFAHQMLPTDSEGYFYGYSPNFNKLPKDKHLDYIFLVGRDFDGQDKIVGYYRNPIIANGTREPINPYYEKYSHVTFKSKPEDIVYFENYILFDSNLFLTGKDLAKQRFTYMNGENIEQLLSFTENVEISVPSSQKEESMKNDQNLNRILFGPPGTGKTYEVRREAVDIITGGNAPAEYKEVVKKFNELKEKGQIEFVTFHPNFGYENFVEGLFPTIKGSKLLTYEVEPGVFKKICDSAEKNLKLSGGSKESDLDQEFEKRWVLLVEEIENNEEYLEFSTQTDIPFKLKLTKTGGTAVENNSGNIHHIAKKRYLSAFIDLSERGIKNPNRGDINASSLTTYIAPVMSKILNYDLNSSQSTEKIKNYVLVIDEINRGNIPAIFGELITLIEPSKRIGNDETLRLTLPLSGEDFGVPSNLYILGTMNTADRSVESLDVALRRRFSFVPKYPNPNLDLIKTIDGIDCSKLLKAMNKRIKILKGDDFQIGHSYFIGLDETHDLIRAFANKVIPLLLEYFFDDLEKVQMILGPSFVKRNPPDESVFATGVYDFDSSETFELRSSDHWNFKSVYE